MSDNKASVSVAKQDQQRYEVLSGCGDVSLPINFRWGVSRNGPYHSFNFEQLGQGVAEVIHLQTTIGERVQESNLGCVGIY